MSEAPQPSSPLIRLFGGMLLALASLALSLLVLEAALRLVPALLPTGSYGAGRLHERLGMNVHAMPALYNKVRRVERAPNSEGFLDAEHARAKPAGVVRVGFFGDSYTEAVQVPHDVTFYRQFAAAPIAGAPIEALAFGISGWGTLHSRLAYETFARDYGLDLAVYVFVENDLGDQLQEVGERMGGSPKPLAHLTPEGYAVAPAAREASSPLRSAAKWAQRSSLLAQVAWTRMLALRRGEAAGAELRASGVPDANALASTWPPEVAERARSVGAFVLADFARTARRDGVHFAVLYTPRGEDQLRGETARENTFAPWLFATCERLAFLCIDPSAALTARSRAGENMYDDHWSPAGHSVVANVLRKGLAPVIAEIHAHEEAAAYAPDAAR
jgi:hypothetical protein